jgi:hypothetical protein
LVKDTEKEHVFAYYSTAHAEGKLFEDVELSDISIDDQLSPLVRVQFQQHFTYGGKTATVRTVLHLTKQDGGWKINFEREFSNTAFRADATLDAPA